MTLRFPSLASALALAVASSVAVAHDQGGKDRVDFRQGAYRIMGWHMGLLGDVGSGEKPFDAALVREWVRHLQWAERLTALTYTADTQAVKGSRLLPKAWSNMDDFRDKGRALKQAIDGLEETADKDNADATRKAIGEVGEACKACHDEYREEMEH